MGEPIEPFANGAGRDGNGRFAAGNKGGPGNPHGRRVAALRSALLAAVDVRDVEKIVAALVKKAKGGDVIAAREILDRVVGKASPMDLLQRVEALEQAWGVDP